MDEEVRRESSLSFQVRVSVVDIARLDEYWKTEGVECRSVSELVSWSVGLMAELLKLPELSVADSYKYVEERNLLQPSLRNRNIKKIANAIRFESMRKEGIKPEDYVPRQHKVVHNKKSVRALNIDKAMEIYNKLNK